MVDQELDIRPVLKWVGGKRELIPEIRKYYEFLQPHRYIEPFFGGGAVYFDVINTFGTDIQSASIINDGNLDLIQLYRHIKTNPAEVISACGELEKEYYSEGFYHIRARYNGEDKQKSPVDRYEGIERTAAFILLNRTCFNGLYRVNSRGLFNVPEGRYKNPRIVDPENLYKVSAILPPEENIRNCEFDEVTEYQKGDLVYFDPPYHPLNITSSFTNYNGSFGENEQVRLRDHFSKLSDLGVYLILSNSSAQLIKELYKDFDPIEVFASRNINSKSEKRGKIPEVLVVSESITSYIP